MLWLEALVSPILCPPPLMDPAAFDADAKLSRDGI